MRTGHCRPSAPHASVLAGPRSAEGGSEVTRRRCLRCQFHYNSDRDSARKAVNGALDVAGFLLLRATRCRKNTMRLPADRMGSWAIRRIQRNGKFWHLMARFCAIYGKDMVTRIVPKRRLPGCRHTSLRKPLITLNDTLRGGMQCYASRFSLRRRYSVSYL